MAKRGVPEHPKTLGLARRLGIAPWAAVGLLECLWHWCSKYALTGEITADSEDIAEALRYGDDSHALITALVESGWLERLPSGSLGIHDVSEHADNTWKAALARAGLQFWDANPQRNIDVVEPKSQLCKDSVTTKSQQSKDKITTKSQQNRASPLPKPLPVPEPSPPLKGAPLPTVGVDIELSWAEFLRVYPPRAGDRKTKAGFEKYRRRIRLGDSPDEILEGAKRYRAFCDAVGFTLTEKVQQLTTWFNGEGWKEPFDLPEQVPRATPATKRLEPVLDRDYYFGDSEPVEDDDGAVRYRMKAFWIRDGKRTDEPFERSDWFDEQGLADLEAVAV